MLVVISFFCILFQVSFQGSYVFYSAMLRKIANSDNNTSVSGIGFGLGQLGNAFALAIIGPIIGTSLVVVGLSGKPLSLLFGGILFGLISIPFLMQKDVALKKEVVHFSYKKFIKKLVSKKRIFLFLIGYSLLSDAILTFQLYIALYIKKIFNSKYQTK